MGKLDVSVVGNNCLHLRALCLFRGMFPRSLHSMAFLSAAEQSTGRNVKYCHQCKNLFSTALSLFSSQMTQIPFFYCLYQDLLMILNSSCGGFDCFLDVAHFRLTELFSERNSNGKIEANRPVGKVEPCVKIQ